MSLTDTYNLSNGIKIPKIAFGTWQTPDGDIAYQSVKTALELGYRHIDTAQAYGNENSIGQAIKDTNISRDKLFITTKLWNQVIDFPSAQRAIDESLMRLKCDTIDLLLIHWPNPLATRPNFAERNSEVWRAMEEAVTAGKVSSLGVSNFQTHHLDALFKTATIKPVVNQIYCNPSDQQEEIVTYNNMHNLLTEAYSPLGTGEIFKIRALNTIAQKYDKTVAQVVLRWHLQKGYLPLPKSVTASRIKENTEIFDFNLSDGDMTFINQLHGALLPHKFPDNVQF
ncbi:aldo/keto reductase [Lactococcus nasutitermitis]|uniref:Aldo/keto reductase n=1 Tax=Lactococcus nasutitermitis TaxID=1652957 RepID=A0ABV9JA80_9LACT|nr:aldo/keto reductase [Lactococcus nasutitermitis]